MATPNEEMDFENLKAMVCKKIPWQWNGDPLEMVGIFPKNQKSPLKKQKSEAKRPFSTVPEVQPKIVPSQDLSQSNFTAYKRAGRQNKSVLNQSLNRHVASPIPQGQAVIKTSLYPQSEISEELRQHNRVHWAYTSLDKKIRLQVEKRMQSPPTRASPKRVRVNQEVQKFEFNKPAILNPQIPSKPKRLKDNYLRQIRRRVVQTKYKTFQLTAEVKRAMEKSRR